MPSFTYTAIIAIAASIASASPLLAGTPQEPKNIEQRDVAVCWGPGNKATDSFGGPWPARCKVSHYEDAFSGPFTTFSSAGGAPVITTKKHITKGPWHCCNSCKGTDQCIGWQIDLDCSCVTWHFGGDNSTLGVYGGPFQNQTGTFHRGPSFPVGPNLIANSTTA